MKKLLFLTFAMLIAVTFNSCRDADCPVDWEDPETIIMSDGIDEFYIFSDDEIVDYNIDAMGTDAQASPRWGNKDDRSNQDKWGRRNNKDFKPGMGNGMYLGKVFRYMELTEEQWALVNGFLQDYRECMKEFYENVMSARKRIYAKYEDQIIRLRNAIRTNPDNRREYFAQLREIHKEMQQLMREAIDWDARCDCIRTLYREINNMDMTDEQRAIWERYLNSLKHHCFVERDSDGSDR